MRPSSGGVTRRVWISAAAAALSGCAGKPREASVIRVGTSFYPSAAPLFLAKEQGYFTAEGIQLEIHQAVASSSHAQMLLAGQLDAALLVLTPGLINGVARGAPVRLVMTRDITTEGCGFAIVWRRKSFPNGYRSPADLRGKKVAFTYAGSTNEFHLEQLLERSGLKWSDVKPIPLRQAEAVAALLAGSLDAMMSASRLGFESGPQATELAVDTSNARVFAGSHVSYAAFGERLRSADRRSGLAFLRAYRKGVQDYLSGKAPSNFAEMAKVSGADAAATLKTCRDTAQAVSVDAASVQSFIDWARARKYVEHAVTADQVIDPSLMKELA